MSQKEHLKITERLRKVGEVGMKREYSDTMLPIVEGKPIPRSAVILDNGEWKTRWWYPEPDDNVDKTYSSALEAVVYCKDCKHRPKKPNFETYESGFDLEFPEGSKCPCRCCGDEWYSWYPDDEWFCADGERKAGND